MRNIRAKAKSKLTGELIFGYVVIWKEWIEETSEWKSHYAIVSEMWCNTPPTSCEEVEEETIRFSTGKFDSQGDEMWEGDTIVFHRFYGESEEHTITFDPVSGGYSPFSIYRQYDGSHDGYYLGDTPQFFTLVPDNN